mgnify:FL=1
MDNPSAIDHRGGLLGSNIMYFGRALRATGIPVGAGQIVDAVTAVSLVGLNSRNEFYWTLHAIFIKRNEHRELFNQAFHIFWRNPNLLEKMMNLSLPQELTDRDNNKNAEESFRRVAEAFAGSGQSEQTDEEERDKTEATLTWSPGESLSEKDFEKMSTEEVKEAITVIKTLRLPNMEVPTRRFSNRQTGKTMDMRRTIRQSLKFSGGFIPIMYKTRKTRRPPLVVICDISGSMERYSRMLLHFMHAVTNDRDRVFTFLFGTRLTNVTRSLKNKDVDVALKHVGKEVLDWSGGTRIGLCLAEFNKYWSRRVLSQGGITILISDGLDRDEASGLDIEMARLHRTSRKLIWLNPLLRYKGFEPKSLGIKTMLPHVDEFKTIHNLSSVRELSLLLS